MVVVVVVVGGGGGALSSSVGVGGTRAGGLEGCVCVSLSRGRARGLFRHSGRACQAPFVEGRLVEAGWEERESVCARAWSEREDSQKRRLAQ